jgi:hypothetical protein
VRDVRLVHKAQVTQLSINCRTHYLSWCVNNCVSLVFEELCGVGGVVLFHAYMRGGCWSHAWSLLALAHRAVH